MADASIGRLALIDDGTKRKLLDSIKISASPRALREKIAFLLLQTDLLVRARPLTRHGSCKFARLTFSRFLTLVVRVQAEI